MTRDIDWGIPVPLEGWEDNPNKRLYVWFDAVDRVPVGVDRVGAPHGRPRRVAPVLERPRGPELLLHGQGQHHVPLPDLAGRAAGATTAAGPRAARRASSATLNLPTEVVSSEFLTMEGKQFSSSRGVVIYVRDMLSRYQPDALRYFLSVAGPENQDSDFTWADFKTRTNSELVAGWGNLVNRTASLIHKNFGEVPTPGELQPVDQGLLATTAAGFGKVGELLGGAPQQGRDRRGDAGGPGGQPVHLRDGAVEAHGRPRPPGHGAAHGRAGGERREHAARAVPAALGAEGARDARRHGDVLAVAADRRGHRPRRRLAPLPDHHRRLRRGGPAAVGSRTRSRPGTPVGQADAGVHQARRRRSSRRSSTGCGRPEWRRADGAGLAASRRSRCRSPVVDNHTHLDTVLRGWPTAGSTASRSTTPTLAAHLDRAASVGVTRMVQVGCDLTPSRGRTRPSARTPSCSAPSRSTPTRRPHAGSRARPTARPGAEVSLADGSTRLARADPRIRAIGETGLDYFRAGPSGRAVQRGGVPRAHRARQGARPRAADPRPRRARRGGRVLLEDGRPGPHGLPLLLRRRGAGAARRRAGLVPARSPARSRSGQRRACARRCARCRRRCCWSRPTRRT